MDGQLNPRRDSRDSFGRNLWYPYYAGFSPRFAVTEIASARLKPGALVVDPWNGGGTTTWAAKYLGFCAWGGDLNPSMLVVAKAKSLGAQNCLSAEALAERIARVKTVNGKVSESDPLIRWLGPTATGHVRGIEHAIKKHVVPDWLRSAEFQDPAELSELACFFYLALFRLAREFARSAKTSNPTWSRKGAGGTELSGADARRRFVEIVGRLVSTVGDSLSPAMIKRATQQDTLAITSSTRLPLPDESTDFVLTSPPYCTRIDYAVATGIELAVLGVCADKQDGLRRSLMGTTTVPRSVGDISPEWGDVCGDFLDKVKNHPSHASAGYYYKSHYQYFADLNASIGELSRILRPAGRAVLVVQDSQYKEIHNDLALIAVQMAESKGMELCGREDFSKPLSMRSLHPHSRKYKKTGAPIESVLRFRMH